ncbi:GNAT family N-acetyltransferase [Aquimarina megaterium]|uniref:GNAT family N-acetyltransferase n=1 Tax=Aquimarina megaterium TaxID=1443666 RepID=UPI000471EFE1|nr:GNAT family protein [Aquimarina megaterium]
MNFEKYAIRLLKINDLNNYFHLINDNRKRLEEIFTGTVLETKTIESTKVFMLKNLERIKDKSYFPYVIIDESDNRFVGFIDLKNIDYNIKKAELGFYMDENYARKGIMTKALNCFCDYYFEKYQFNKLFLRTHPDNFSTRKLAEKCGFKIEGVIRNDYMTTSGKIIDLVYYGRLSYEKQTTTNNE